MVMIFEMMNIMWPALIALTVWSMIWKGIGMWKAGRNDQLVWFICMFIFNTIGILPIIYLLFFQKKRKH
jgi:methionyl-tRNA synthetase